MRRLSTFVIALGGVSLVGGWLVGGSGGTSLAFVFFGASVVVLALGLVMRRLAAGRTRLADGRWQAPPIRSHDSPTSSETAHRLGRPVRELGFVETRELLSSPWFAVGVALTLLELLLFGFLWGGDYSEHWWSVGSALTLFIHPFVGMLVIAGHRAATRARRERVR